MNALTSSRHCTSIIARVCPSSRNILGQEEVLYPCRSTHPSVNQKCFSQKEVLHPYPTTRMSINQNILAEKGTLPLCWHASVRQPEIF